MQPTNPGRLRAERGLRGCDTGTGAGLSRAGRGRVPVAPVAPWPGGAEGCEAAPCRRGCPKLAEAPQARTLTLRAGSRGHGAPGRRNGKPVGRPRDRRQGSGHRPQPQFYRTEVSSTPAPSVPKQPC